MGFYVLQGSRQLVLLGLVTPAVVGLLAMLAAPRGARWWQRGVAAVTVTGMLLLFEALALAPIFYVTD